jgi:hypothetical protein
MILRALISIVILLAYVNFAATMSKHGKKEKQFRERSLFTPRRSPPFTLLRSSLIALYARRYSLSPSFALHSSLFSVFARHTFAFRSLLVRSSLASLVALRSHPPY